MAKVVPTKASKIEPKLKIISARAELYFGENGMKDGILVHVQGEKKADYVPADLQMNVQGDVWKAVPSSIASIIQWTFLPLKMFPGYMDKEDFKQGETQFSVTTRLGTKTHGTPGVAHQTIIDRLNDQIKAGNPVILLEFLDRPNLTTFELVTTPSLILKSLESGKDAKTSIIHTGPTPEFTRTILSKEDDEVTVGLWVVVPIAFWVAVSWFVVQYLKKSESFW